MDTDLLRRLIQIYEGSDGDATRRLYEQLETYGPVGIVALNIFRAQKCSARAKVYRGGNSGGSYRRQAYERKQWSLDNLCDALAQYGVALRIRYGWGLDPAAVGFEQVLYVELPTGQVSFHAAVRGTGPDHPDGWDGRRGLGVDRMLRFVGQVIESGRVRA